MTQSALPPTFWRGTVPHLLRHSLLTVLIFRLLVSTIYTLLLSPVVLGVMDIFIALSGNPIVANMGIVGFARSPAGIVLIVLAVIAFVFAELFQLAALSLINLRALQRQPSSLYGTLRVLVARARPLISAALALSALVVVVALPLAAVAGLVYWLLLSGADINFFLATKPPRFLIAVGIGVILIIIGLIAWLIAQVRLIFVAPIVMFEGIGGFDALRMSDAMTQGQRGRIGRALLAWLGIAFALLLAAALITSGIFAVVAPRPGASPTGITVAFTILFLVTAIVAAFQSVVAPFLYAALNAYLYANLRVHGDLPLMPELPHGLDANARHVNNKKLRLGLVGAGGLFLLVLAVLIGFSAQGFATRPNIMIMAHRAGAAGVPENSLTALHRAIEQRIATYAEIDVQETADGVVMVIHDSDLRRLANVNARVWDLTLAQIEQADIGSNVGPQFAGERIPTLDEFLDAAKGKIKLNIELKYDRDAPLLAGKVVNQVRAKGMQNEVVISSLNDEGLVQVRKLAPELKIGLIYQIEIGSIERLDVDFLEPEASQVTPEMMNIADARGLPVYAWTIDDEASAQNMYDAGVSAVISNNPPLAQKALAERSTLSDPELIMVRFRQLFGL